MLHLPKLLPVLLLLVARGNCDDVTPSSTSSLLLQRLGEQVQAMSEEEGGGVVPQESSSVEPSTTQAPPKPAKPEMYSLRVTSRIDYRFANTLISSRLANPANTSQEVFFSVVLPETAFISKFLMEVKGKVYEAYVREKEEAKHEYEQAVAAGLGAAHVALSARDSNRFTVSVNIEPLAKVTFNLTYEELLTRRLGAYNHVINLDPGQVVRELRVDVYIREARNITTLRVPELRSGNEVDANELTKANPLARVERTSATEAHVVFAPTAEEQKALGKVKGAVGEDTTSGGLEEIVPSSKAPQEGLGGQFVVQYDVARDPQAGEVLVNNGFFVHFFAPSDLPPLRKHALFVLDVSGSMDGRKIEQLKEAMIAILDDLNEGDYFNIIEFSYSVTVWNLDSAAASAVFSPYYSYNYDASVPAPNPMPTPAFPATPEYVAKAKEIVNKMRAGGGTNIYDTLKTVLRVARSGLENITAEATNQSAALPAREPIIVFLTDGEPTVGETRLSKIFSLVDELNDAPSASIFSLAFGDDADLGFLKKLSLKNAGFARKIYEASDAALQLRDFYRQIASPLLANVTFSYLPEQVVQDSTTRVKFHTLFSGSELVVAGRLATSNASITAIQGEISSISAAGESTMLLPPLIDLVPASPVAAGADEEVTPLERLWAYLTIKQLLEKEDERGAEGEEAEGANTTTTAADSPKKEALQLALKYSFVTPLTSLVVVKPNETKAGGSEAVDPVDGDTSNKYGGFSGSFGPVDRRGSAGITLPLSSSAFSGGLAPMPISLQQGLPGAPPALLASYGPQSNTGFGGIPVYPPGPPPRTTTYVPRPTSSGAWLPERPEVLEEDIDVGVGAPMTEDYETNSEADKGFNLVDLNALSWLAPLRSGNNVTLPFGANQSDVVYHLQPTEQMSSWLLAAECETPSGAPGKCLHLHNCSLSMFKDDIAVYRTYFCSIDSYAGACCPVPSILQLSERVEATSLAAATSEATSLAAVTSEATSLAAVTSDATTTSAPASSLVTSVSQVTSSTPHATTA